MGDVERVKEVLGGVKDTCRARQSEKTSSVNETFGS